MIIFECNVPLKELYPLKYIFCQTTDSYWGAQDEEAEREPILFHISENP